MDRLLTNKERNIYYHEGELDNQGLLKAQDAKTANYYEGIMAQENQVLIKKIEDTFPFLTTHKCEIAICEADNKPCCEQATYCGYYKWLIIKQEIGDGK
jgi:hypothetical protein